ncbi:hypothetical protein PpBr36_00968 [Pyricularia pennisetigena]|uniref:hypothetical protein n=1 Tax=Pyricularia pennisetigena TaxID=1578925 RepID=UPI00114EEBFC|nr:hypothetical protein PpBr36_00968 [Pyricularia pennisetigena]TLS29454.1 hypothetical protein PpBr36_00968 [Pyricularia pennisetigena]
MSPAEHLPPKAYLVPCDFTSAAHTGLLYNQRVTCGWAEGGIETWKTLSAQGNLVMYWLVLDDGLPEKDDLIKTHCERYPNQATPVQDTAAQIWGQQRKPSNASFIPIGHIGLGRLQPESEYVLTMKQVQPPPGPTDVITWIGPLYISWAMQRLGIGNLAMTETERLAASPPVNGTIVALDAIAPDHALAPALLRTYYTHLGIPLPVRSNHDWYLSKGYRPYHRKTAYPWTDTVTGEVNMLDTVYMQKRL